jgi:hypothetical protein
VLGDLEIEKLFMFSGFAMAGDETTVVSCFAHAEMLEGFDPSEDVAGYEEAILSLEKEVMKSEGIMPDQVVSDGDQNCTRQSVFVFQPP